MAAKNPESKKFPGYPGHSVAGFVWEEEGLIVGNISLIPVFVLSKRAYLIANVAVHPNFRRKGIAKSLTNAALEQIKNLRIRSVWLQVNSENPAAYLLYNSIGFTERARRTTWRSQKNWEPKFSGAKAILVSKPKRKDWPNQQKWLNENYPNLISWHLAINTKQLVPGFLAGVNRFFDEKKVRQWAAHHEGQLIGTLSWQSSKGMADWLWLACTEENEDRVIKSLLPHAIQLLKVNRQLTLNYMAGRAVESFQEVGFKSHRTLVWMSLILS
jgi:N-acetylglutamate synthase-like GNAT family acetyltransferase